MPRILFFLWCLGTVIFSLHAQPVTVPKKSLMNIHSDAHSLFTRFKDRHFSNYQYWDELKNVELHANIYAGASMSIGDPVAMYGFDAGGGFILDYYLKEGVALRTGFGVKGFRLYRNLKLQIVDDVGDAVATGIQSYRARMTQITIPLHFLITKFRYNRGFWSSFGVTFALNVNGHYQLKNQSQGTIPPGFEFPHSPNVRSFDSNIGGLPGNTYFNRVSVYLNAVLGYKFSRFLNFYIALHGGITPMHNAIAHTIYNQSLNFGTLVSLWQY